MGSAWKIVVPVVLVVIIGGVIFYSQYSKTPSGQEFATGNPPAPVTTPEVKPAAPAPVSSVQTPPATGNVDDAVNATISESNSDQARFQSESGDAAQVNSDSKAISNVNQSYDPNQL